MSVEGSSSLAEAFRARAPTPLASVFESDAALEDALREAESEGRRAWPSVRLRAADFVAHLSSKLRVSPSIAQALAAVDLPGLYLAAACLERDSLALEALQLRLQAAIDQRASRLEASDFPEELGQRLMVRLVVGVGGSPPELALYSGRGTLERWLRAAVVHASLNSQRSDLRRQKIEGEGEQLSLTVANGKDLELQYIKARHKTDFNAALREGLAALSARERALLRLHLTEGVSVDGLARFYRTHRTTVWRWLSAARARLLSETRQALRRRVGVEDSELDSLLRLLQSGLDASLGTLLRELDAAGECRPE